MPAGFLMSPFRARAQEPSEELGNDTQCPVWLVRLVAFSQSVGISSLPVISMVISVIAMTHLSSR